MKTILLLLVCGVTFCYPWKKVEDVSGPSLVDVPIVPDTINFTAQIQPILQNHCNPCHFPGGKMYEAMPFDQGKTLIGRREGVMKRIKDKEESKLLEAFIAQVEQSAKH